MILELFEKIDVRKGIGSVVTDFQNSDAPQFKNKSKKEIRDMALAAYFAKKEGTEPDYIKDFLAKGGKIKKLPPGKAAGWHGKSDLGTGMKGLLAKGSAKKLGLKGHGKHLDTSTPVHKEARGVPRTYAKTYSSLNLKKARELMSPAKHREDGINRIAKGMGISKAKATKHHDDVMKSYGFKAEEKGRGPTGIAYSLPKGHPDAENPATREKYPERQTPKYKANWEKRKVKKESYGQPSDRMKERNKAYKLKLKRDHEYEMKHGRKKDTRGIGENTSDITYAASMHFDNPSIKVKKASGGKYHVPMKSYHTKKDAQSFASQHGLKLHSHEKTMGGSRATVSVESTMKTFDEIRESTNWKGGSKHIGLARYSAKNGYGVQITQIKAMPGDKMNWAKGAGFVKMPVKDIPKLCKALMNVYKAPANVQLGDDD